MNSTLCRPDDYRENDYKACPACNGKRGHYYSVNEDGVGFNECVQCSGFGQIELTDEEQAEKDFENEYEW